MASGPWWLSSVYGCPAPFGSHRDPGVSVAPPLAGRSHFLLVHGRTFQLGPSSLMCHRDGKLHTGSSRKSTLPPRPAAARCRKGHETAEANPAVSRTARPPRSLRRCPILRNLSPGRWDPTNGGGRIDDGGRASCRDGWEVRRCPGVAEGLPACRPHRDRAARRLPPGDPGLLRPRSAPLLGF
jgi:hypothetical protein